jgi:hypothetical protein
MKKIKQGFWCCACIKEDYLLKEYVFYGRKHILFFYNFPCMNIMNYTESIGKFCFLGFLSALKGWNVETKKQHIQQILKNKKICISNFGFELSRITNFQNNMHRVSTSGPATHPLIQTPGIVRLCIYMVLMLWLMLYIYISQKWKW